MKRRSKYNNYVYVILYVMLLRVVLYFTVGMSLRLTGLFYDLVVMMFWVGVFAYFIHSHVRQKIYYIIVVHGNG